MQTHEYMNGMKLLAPREFSWAQPHTHLNLVEMRDADFGLWRLETNVIGFKAGLDARLRYVKTTELVRGGDFFSKTHTLLQTLANLGANATLEILTIVGDKHLLGLKKFCLMHCNGLKLTESCLRKFLTGHRSLLNHIELLGVRYLKIDPDRLVEMLKTTLAASIFPILKLGCQSLAGKNEKSFYNSYARRVVHGILDPDPRLVLNVKYFKLEGFTIISPQSLVAIVHSWLQQANRESRHFDFSQSPKNTRANFTIPFLNQVCSELNLVRPIWDQILFSVCPHLQQHHQWVDRHRQRYKREPSVVHLVIRTTSRIMSRLNFVLRCD